METPRLFVYGTLMHGCNNAALLEGKVLKRERARTRGRLYHLPHRGYPAMLDGETWVYGELLWLRGAEALTVLDMLEGYHGPDRADNLYHRRQQTVESAKDHTSYQAHLYVYNCREREVFERTALYLPEGDWRAYCADSSEA